MSVMLMGLHHGWTMYLCSQEMQIKLHSIAILDMLPSSDHVPLSFVFDFNSSPTFNENFTCPSNKTNFNRAISTNKDLTDYKYLTRCADYLLWKASGKPWAGLLYLNMC